uniref:Uncharacterized protein n=1 Tax=Candidatus Kentrum sp. FM TaxID=2126340 RepID=A0A450VNP1_9GAMM|nr:MAG: hypothetical protein BECKFM1743C_GA0114222_1002211 [Candidatus Kentron sp. FM]VFJ46553.1 MAG: hypothetical protein BECKFM1743A_GA0114220_100388 [Candidatus Kentron sp. FM]VFK06361.1 MAG: hypothetical protein BECKFM1743B_GA0114221_100156 [Candidatus Kentron sp. FM]
MAYGTFKTVEEVAIKFDIEVAGKTAFMGQKALEVPAPRLEMVIENFHDDMSFINEVTICEQIISPILTIVSRNHKPIGVWSHVPYNVDEKAGLVGEPDYLIAPRTKYGGMARPALCVIEAKRDDFDLGWAQALAEMVASASSGAPFCYGVVTTGKLWEFGRLTNDAFTVDPVSVSALKNLQDTFDALNWLFGEIAKQYDFSSPILPEKRGV